MKSRFSKLSAGLTLIIAGGTLNSCALFGGGKYAKQMEVETEVPESLEQGKPSTGPSAGQTDLYAANSGVPATSNLVEVPDPWQPPGQLPPLPGTSQPGTSQPGGASLTGLPPEGGRPMIDIPKPEFDNVSVHNVRPKAEGLSIGSPLPPAGSRMSLSGARPGYLSSGVVKETVEPLATTAPKESEIASAPKAVTSGNAEPAVPLLHSGARLSDFYQNIHQELLTASVVENQAPPAETVVSPTDESLSVPPPPPADPAPPPPPPGQ